MRTASTGLVGLSELLGESALTAEQDVQNKYRTLIENIPLVTYIDAIDDDSSALYMSPQIEPLLGYPVQQWLDDPELFTKLLHPDDREHVLNLVRRTNDTGELFRAEYRLVARDGHAVWFRDEAVFRFHAADQPSCYLGYMLDITGRKEVEQRLKEAETKYRNLVEQLPAIAYLVTLDGKKRQWHYVSPKVKSVLGFRPDELRVDPGLWFRQLHLDDREAVLQAESQFQTTGKYDVEYRLLTAVGSPIWFHDCGTVVLDDDGKPTRLQGVMLDVSARHVE